MKKYSPARTVIDVDPNRCRVWNLHPRFAADVNAKTCEAEIATMAVHGQVVPVIGRPLRNDPDYDVELICGARRLFAARHLNVRLRVDLRELDDREALVALEIENSMRRDISAYERGIAYRRWLRQGKFENQEDLARQLSLASSQVSRYLRIAQLPAVVLDAFETPRVVRENWGLALMDALEDVRRRNAVLKTARTLSVLTPRLPARDVVRKLLAAPLHSGRKQGHIRDQVVTAIDGSALFRIRHLRRTVSLLFPVERMSNSTLARIESDLAYILRSTASGVSADHPPNQTTRVPDSDPVHRGAQFALRRRMSVRGGAKREPGEQSA